MSEDRPRCRYCGEPTTLRSHGSTCCWCRLVEEKAERVLGCEDCALALRRFEPIQARFRTAIEATRENCLRLLNEGLRQPLEAMPGILRTHFRKRPEVALQAILATAAANLTTTIRERIKP